MTSGVSQTKAQADEMEQSAKQFERVNDELQSMLSKLMSELDVLEKTWQGHGARAFDDVKVRWARDQKLMSDALAETAAAIRTSSTSYTATDSDASARIANTNHGITLPL